MKSNVGFFPEHVECYYAMLLPCTCSILARNLGSECMSWSTSMGCGLNINLIFKDYIGAILVHPTSEYATQRPIWNLGSILHHSLFLIAFVVLVLVFYAWLLWREGGTSVLRTSHTDLKNPSRTQPSLRSSWEGMRCCLLLSTSLVQAGDGGLDSAPLQQTLQLPLRWHLLRGGHGWSDGLHSTVPRVDRGQGRSAISAPVSC